jgi:hypothetical protein
MDQTKQPRISRSSKGRYALFYGGWWQLAVVFSLVCALALGVATRYSEYSSLATSTTTSSMHDGAQNQRQHMDRDAFVWRVALVACVLLERPSHYAPLVPSSPELAASFYDRELYNRPPPSALYS